MCFGDGQCKQKVKHVLKDNDGGYLATSEPETMVKMAFSTITQDNCLNYTRHSGYMV